MFSLNSSNQYFLYQGHCDMRKSFDGLCGVVVSELASTAIAGTHYTVPASGSVNLAANSSSVTLPITLIPGSVTATAGVRLIINLDQAAGGIQPNPNFRTYTLTITP